MPGAGEEWAGQCGRSSRRRYCESPQAGTRNATNVPSVRIPAAPADVGWQQARRLRAAGAEGTTGRAMTRRSGRRQARPGSRAQIRVPHARLRAREVRMRAARGIAVPTHRGGPTPPANHPGQAHPAPGGTAPNGLLDIMWIIGESVNSGNGADAGRFAADAPMRRLLYRALRAHARSAAHGRPAPAQPPIVHARAATFDPVGATPSIANRRPSIIERRRPIRPIRPGRPAAAGVLEPDPPARSRPRRRSPGRWLPPINTSQ